MPRHRAGAHRRSHIVKRLQRFLNSEIQSPTLQAPHVLQSTTPGKQVPKIISLQEGYFATRIDQNTFRIIFKSDTIPARINTRCEEPDIEILYECVEL